ncbi:MAG: YeeE/YedE family protein [Candidatus Accumulibacter sp.]|uniref:YeeE/YedE family protein n=1 Tax=Accumulibacter sp. TaxID=2053492 RepID=UPI001A589A11|nr:YeeE/YedE family protein [Accumulibacter sp.]MBL8396391.1 YeeE/YedE family protein [Accumulibacter sp.]
MDPMSTASIVLWLAFALGAAFGAVASHTRFCTMGAVADIVNLGDWTRMRMWLLAIAVAILGSAVLHVGGQIDLDKSIYRTPSFNWLSHLLGGLSFGFGMVLASGCGARTLVRIGAGNLKALVVFIVLGLVAYMSMRGVLGVFRVQVLEQVSMYLAAGQGLPAMLVRFGLAPRAALPLCALVIGGGLLAFVFISRDRLSFDIVLGGVVVGLLVTAGWYVSGHLGYLAEDPETLQEAFLATNSGRMESLTFVAPQAYTLELLMLWSDSSRRLTFAIASGLGVIVGSLAHALCSGNFRWEGFHDVEDTVNHLVGAVLMGFGGVVAMGCTIGQGISGVSTLAVGSFLTLFSIIAGARLALAYQYWRAERAA